MSGDPWPDDRDLGIPVADIPRETGETLAAEIAKQMRAEGHAATAEGCVVTVQLWQAPSVENVETTFPDLRALRLAAGLTQRQVADALGLAPSAYADIERGRRKLRDRHVDALARALGVDREAVRPTCPVCGR